MPDSRGMVLVVDDDQDWTEAISDFLEEEGYAVAVAPDGIAAMERLSEMRPFAVVTDIQMPIMDGRQLLGRVHAQDAHVPVIVVTGERVRRDDASLAGAFRVIRKPVPMKDLLSALRAAKAHRARRLPLQKLWLAARMISRSRGERVSRPVWETIHRVSSSLLPPASARHAVMLTIALASSVAFLRHWRGRFS